MSLLPVGISGEEANYQIERSLRFNSPDSAYLSRTPASAGNRKTFTYSGWLKRSALTGRQSIFSAGTTNTTNQPGGGFYLNNSTNKLEVVHGGGTTVYMVTTQVFRDPSAWFHLVVAYDTTQASSSNRIKIYVNGAQITVFDTATYPSQNYDFDFNNTIVHAIGSRTDDGPIPSTLWNGYMTEINFIDGQALTPSSFGETDTDTGVWKPKKYTGTYGTNGFYLNFSDNSGVTSTTLGADSSGNGNNWTPNNFSVTAGAGNDSLVDTPTNYGTDTGVGGEVRGNYSTFNPISTLSASATLSNGNLDVTTVNSGDQSVPSTIYVSSGKWYMEFTCTKVGSGGSSVGILPVIYATGTQIGDTTDSYAYRSSGNKRTNGANSAYGASWTTNDVISIALDLDAGTLVFYKNGSTQGTAFSSISGTFTFAWCDTSGTDTTSAVANFGQRPFAYTAPSGFKALCTQNLPEPTIVDGGEYFNTVLYTGNGSSLSVTGVGFQPDWVWGKSRSNATNNFLYDSVRGVNKRLISDSTAAETDETGGGLSSFNSDGFTVQANSTENGNARTFVAWNWKANGAGVSNTAGTITSTVSANTDSGFSIVTYTGTGANATVGHGLGVAPSMIILKRRDSTNSWQVYHSNANASPASGGLFLNTTDAFTTLSTTWNNTVPTSTVFSIGTAAGTNTNTGTYVAYCFAAIPGYSAFGSYTGNGSTDGPFVYTGFRPAFVLTKRTDSAGGWYIFDDVRSTYNLNATILQPNLADAEWTGTNNSYDFLSNGFKNRGTGGDNNASGGTYIYAAFAENPFKLSLAR